MSNQRNSPPKTILDHWGLKLSTNPVSGSERRPTLSLKISRNDPVLTVWTNVQGDKENGRIEMRLDANTFLTLISYIRQLRTLEPDRRLVIEHHDYSFNGGRRSEKPMLRSKVTVGRDKEGIAYIAVTSWDRERPLIRFPFLPSKNYVLMDESGNQIERDRISLMFSTGWADAMSRMATHFMIHNYKEPESKRDRGDRQQSGYRSQQSNNDYNNDDDDYPL